MKLTTIFKFKKPDGTDTVNIQDINDNFDVVETVLKRTDEAQAGTKATLADGDKVVILDSADGAKKLTTWAQAVAAVKTAVGSAYAAAAHKHSAADVTSGTLGLTRGGTGATSAAAARTALNAACKTGDQLSGDFYLQGTLDFMDGGKVTGVPDPLLSSDAANKAYVDSKMLVFTGKTVATSAWTSNTTYSAQGYGFRAAVACTGVTASHRPDVAFSCADAVGGNFAPVADSYAGGVYIYCKTKPTATVTIPSIVCVKGA